MFIKNILFVLLLLISTSVFADSVKRDNPFESISVSTPDYYPDFKHFSPRLGKYSYTVDWQGIPAAEIEAVVRQEGLRYLVDINVKTNDFRRRLLQASLQK